MKPITSFQGEYRFLSNFWPATVRFAGETYPTVEHAYQAAKFDDHTTRELCRNAPTPGTAKRIGRTHVLRYSWHAERETIMLNLVMQKFDRHPELKMLLAATKNAQLIEGNRWNDRFWGECPLGTGENKLGKILMQVRAELCQWAQLDNGLST